MRKPLAIALPVFYALAVYIGTRPPKPTYVMANRTVMTVTDKGGPAILNAPEPEYPPQALRDGIEGGVVLKVTIAADGTVANAVPVRGPEPLHQAAIANVRRYQFAAKPGETEIEVGFSLRMPFRSVIQPEPLTRTTVAPSAQTHGAVRVVAMVNPEGRVEFVHPVSGPPQLVPAALESVRQWTFRPMLRDGIPGSGTAVVDVQL